MRRERTRLAALLPALLILLPACTGGGGGDGDGGTQPVTVGRIVGTVRTADGAPLQGASVTTEPATVTATTDADGAYVLADLTPGAYRVLAQADGFVAGQSDEVSLAADDTVSVDLTLDAMVVYASTCESCHLQQGELLADLAADPMPEDPGEGGSAGEG